MSVFNKELLTYLLANIFHIGERKGLINRQESYNTVRMPVSKTEAFMRWKWTESHKSCYTEQLAFSISSRDLSQSSLTLIRLPSLAIIRDRRSRSCYKDYRNTA